MAEGNDSHLESVYSTLLETLEGKQREQLVKCMEAPEAALRIALQEGEDALEELEQDLQSAVSDYEDAQQVLSALEEDTAAPPAEVETARAEHAQATKTMEECMAQRAVRADRFTAAKETAKEQRTSALRAAIHQFGSKEPTAPRIPNVTPFEPLQTEHVDLVIRIGRFDKVGIAVKPDGVIDTAPGGLFDSDYQLIGIDGKLYHPGLENLDGTHTIVLRCRNAEMLASLHRVPSKLLRGKALKLMQLKISPGDKGFGIDLSEVNHVAGLVKGGKAEAADLRPGDVIVAADGVSIGKKRLVEVLRKGRPSYVFNVVRPAMPAPHDRADELVDSASAGSTPAAPTKPAPLPTRPSAAPVVNGSSVPVAANGVAPTPLERPALDAASDEVEDDLKKSLAEALGRMQQTSDMLQQTSDMPALRIVRCMSKDGTAITVEWAPRPGCPKISHYHLQWKLVNDAEWTHTEASKKVAATVVTKGNLKPDGLYQFRVRGCSKQSGEWGAWCPPTTPLAPTQDVPDHDEAALSTIEEERSEVASAIGTEIGKVPSPSAPKEVWSDLPTPSADTAGGAGLAMDVVKGMLKDQRQALEAQGKQELEAARADVDATNAEIEDWKNKFLEAAGNSMQQVVEAKEVTRAEVLAELEEQTRAAEAMRLEASQAVELIRAAEKVAEEAKVEAAHYKKRFDDAKAEAKAETDREADLKVNHVMRNAAMELRDKVKFVEQQTDATVKRAVAEAVRIAEAKAEIEKRNERRELEAAHDKQLQAMRDMVGAGAKHRISEVQSLQDGRVEAAVRTARAEAHEKAVREQAVAVQTAVSEAVKDTEARMLSRQVVLEQQLVSVKKDDEARMAKMYTEENVEALVHKARMETQKAQEKSLREVAERAEEKAVLERQRALDTVSQTIKKSVREREMELLAHNGKGLQELADKELKEASKVVAYAGKQAAEQWSTENDDFEERVLKKTQPIATPHLSMHDGLEPPASKAKSKSKPPAKLSAAGLREHDDVLDEGVPLPGMGKWAAANEDNDGNESMVAPPVEYLRLKARHAAEEDALLARQSADQYREEDENEDDERSLANTRREGRTKRNAEREALKQRQFKEAVDAGSGLLNEDRAQRARDGEVDVTEFRSPSEDDIKARTSQHPELRKAFEKVNDLEQKLRTMQVQNAEQTAKSIAVDRGDTMLARENVQTILQKGADKGITDAEREGLYEVMDLLQQHITRDQKMKAMLREIEPASAQDHETASCVQQDLSRDEDQMSALALQLQDLIQRDTNAKLNDDEAALLRQLTSELKSQQEHAEMRKAQITWLQAESKRARLSAVLEARAELEQLHADAVDGEKLALPTTPIAAAEDAFSIAVDWVAPVSELAVRFHLQWRSDEDKQWTSSSASENIQVPCCTKGHLRTQLAYQFRVRAADKHGKWGPWSAPTEATTPSVLLNSVPSRPQLRTLSRGRVEARWLPPEGPSSVSYELQWRKCDGVWGEDAASSLETEKVIGKTPSLPTGVYYSFRVRASVERYRGTHMTEWSPPSAPLLLEDKEPKEGDTKPKAKMKAPRAPPVRPDEEATESVIEADLRGVLNSYHPTAQAAVEAKLAEVKAQRAEDESNVKTLEQRNRAIASKARDDQLAELVKMKRAALNRAVENGEAVENGDEPSKQAVSSWD